MFAALSAIRGRFRHMGTAYFVLALSLVPTITAFYLVTEIVNARDHTRFEGRVRDIRDALSLRATAYVDQLFDLQGFYVSQEKSNRMKEADWHLFLKSRDITNRYPGLDFIAYADRIVDTNRANHEVHKRKENPSYSIRGTPGQDAYYPIIFIEPDDERRRSVLGYDMNSIQAARPAMAQSRDTGQPVLSGRLDLLTFSRGTPQPGFLIVYPIYDHPLVTESERSVERRRIAIDAYIMAGIQYRRFVQKAVDPEILRTVALQIYDGEENRNDNLVFDSRGDAEAFKSGVGNRSPRPRFRSAASTSVNGQTWSLVFSSQPAFDEESPSVLPTVFLFGGLVFSFALFGITWAQANARNVAERLALDLKGAQERDRLIARATNDVIWDWDVEKNRITWNEAIQAMFGYPADRIQHNIEWWRDRIHPDDRRRITSGRESAIQTGGEFWADEYRFRRGDDSYAHVIDRGYVIHNREQRAVRMIGSMVDVTGRKQAEEARRKSEQKLQLHVEQTPMAVIEWNLDFEVTEWNPGAERVFGYSASEAVGKHASELIIPASERQRVEKGWKELIHPKLRSPSDTNELVSSGRRSVNENSTKDGRIIICDWYNTPLVDVDGQIVGVASLALDITERKRAEEALAAEKERLSVTLRSIGDGVITADTTARITLMNRAAENLTGWKQNEAIHRPIASVFNVVKAKTYEACESPVTRVLESGQMVELPQHGVLIARGGEERIVASSGAPIHDHDGRIIGAALVFRDITAQQAMAEELLRAGKIESLAILAGGIAHDFNNILTAVLGNISLGKIYASRDPKVSERLDEAEKAALRARDLTQQLLTFAKGGAPVRQTASIRDLIRDSSEFALRGSSVRGDYSLSQDLWPVEVDEGQISQVINNLSLNAVQAMPGGGILKVTASNIILGADSNIPLTPGRFIMVSIEDHGTGIRSENLSKIFDPYFTTKQQGSGLGLATSYSIIKRHDGLITVESEVGVGTTFNVFLPASANAPKSAARSSTEPLTGTGRVLIMDDEHHILKLASAALGEFGYKVVTSSEGADAVKRYSEAMEKGVPFAAVIMDLTIPGGMGGKEAMKQILALDPKARGIVSSGYSNDPVMANYREHGFSGVVAKPYRIEDLAKVLREITRAPNGT